MRSIFLCDDPAVIARVYAPQTVATLRQTAGLDATVYTAAHLRETPTAFADVDFVFSSWCMPCLTEAEIGAFLPSLKAVFYAAGSVQAFARPFLHGGVRVFSAWAANAVPVAEYTVAQILLADKGFYATAAHLSKGGDYGEALALREHFPGNYGACIGIIGAGMIGKMVIERLAAYRLSVMVFDPFLPDETAKTLGVKKCDLPTLFRNAQVVTNHLANNAETRGMLNYPLFASMPPYATFLNTGRGAQVVEDDLVRALRERPDLTAVLDVTDPEPPRADHPFFALQNCFLTPHIAGSSGDEVHRMAAYMAEEYERFKNGEQTRYEVTVDMLKTMA